MGLGQLLSLLVTAQAQQNIVAWIVPHTHDDVGWLETVDEYYMSQVQWILDTTVRSLLEEPQRKFTYVEIAFFKRWWEEQSDEMKDATRGLVKSGQLKFNLAGYCMSDEATPHYVAEVNQLTEGHQFLLKEFGAYALPKVGWHIDPFGHSSATPGMMAQAGLKAFGLNRIDFRLMNDLKSRQGLEFVWRASPSLGSKQDLWMHIMDSHYCTPGECGYDGDLTLQWDRRLPTYEYNLPKQAEKFAAMIKDRQRFYKHKNVLIPFGCDFSHQNAHKSFKQMDKLIEYINNNNTLGVSARYAHFDDYYTQVQQEVKDWEVVGATDFFPYASGLHEYWTGYFTSRVTLKGTVRSRDSVLRTGEIFKILSNDSKQDGTAVQYLREASAVSQHHDGVSGTSKQHVAEDYIKMLQKGSELVNGMSSKVLASTVSQGKNPPGLTVDASAVVRGLTTSNAAAVVVWNNLGWARRSFVQVYVPRNDVAVYDTQGAVVPSQINPVPSYELGATEKYKLYFLAATPALGFQTYFIRVNSKDAVVGKVQPFPATSSVQSATYKVDLNGATGQISQVTNLQRGISRKIQEQWVAYNPSDYRDGDHASGAYAFRPAQEGRSGVGNSDRSEFKKVDFSFWRPMKQPTVIITPNGQNYNDTFGISLRRQAGGNGFTLNVRRSQDQDHDWGQNLKANYLAFEQGNTGLPDGFQTGSVAVKPQSGRSTVTVNFPSAFAAAPRVLATVRGTSEYDDVFAVTVYGVSTTGCGFSVDRIGGQGWGQDLAIDWVAWPTNAKSPAPTSPVLPVFEHGSVRVGPSSSRLQTFNVKLTAPTHDDPIVMLQPRIAGGAPAGGVLLSTVRTSGLNSFSANVVMAGDASWKEDLWVDYLVYPRQHLESPAVSGTPNEAQVVVGPLVQEVQVKYRNNYAKTIRLYTDPVAKDNVEANQVEQVYEIGPLDERTELSARFFTDLKTNGNFYTDSNGLEIMKRTTDLTKDEPIAGNYYPSVTRSFLRDSNNVQLTLIHDRTHGVASISEGQIEVMIHRRCRSDDSYGVGEVLNENDRINPVLWLVVDDIANSTAAHRSLGLTTQFPVSTFLANVDSPDTWTKSYKTTWSGMKSGMSLPPNVHLLSLSKYDSATILRLQHLYAIDEHATLSKPLQLSLAKLFETDFVKVSNATETLLTGTLPIGGSSTDVTLSPRELRTFIISP